MGSRFLARFLPPAGLSDRQRAAWRPRPSPAGWARCYTFGPTFRAENSNTPRHLAEFWMVEPEVAFFDSAGNMDLAERFLKRIFRDVLEKCPEDMEFFNERIDKTVLDTLQHILDSEFLRVAVHRGRGDLEGIGPDVRVSRRLGQRPPGRARAVPDRKALQAAGHPLRLSPDDQAVLHAGERRRPHGAGDGRAGAEGGRDHRRQPARGAARRAGNADEGAGPRSRRATGGISTCGVTARCRTPVSAWASSGSCCSSPAWPTSAT